MKYDYRFVSPNLQCIPQCGNPSHAVFPRWSFRPFKSSPISNCNSDELQFDRLTNGIQRFRIQYNFQQPYVLHICVYIHTDFIYVSQNNNAKRALAIHKQSIFIYVHTSKYIFAYRTYLKVHNSYVSVLYSYIKTNLFLLILQKYI